jgi:xanthine dehydrogenase iron-sulfur cluster and FAD-binding subunit A
LAEYDAMNALLSYLTENCCRGDPAGCGPGTCDTTTMVIAKKGARQ